VTLEQGGPVRSMQGYAICTEPRSGSNFLCRILTSTGILGLPMEYFNAATVARVRGLADYPTDPESQLALIPQIAATPNGVYRMKVFSVEFKAIQAMRWPQRLPSLALVHLERHDVLGQAISHVRAQQTQQWTSNVQAQAKPSYNREWIGNELIRLVNANAHWRYFFARNGFSVLNLVYEQIQRYPQQTAETVARWIGLTETPHVDLTRTRPLEIQRDALNDEWRARFVAEARDLGAFP